MLNKIFLMGRLVADPETRQTPSGVSVTTFRLAVDRDFKNRETGEREADFITIVAWRGTAEFVSKYFSKGRMALVEGRLQIRQYEKDGQKRSAAEVVAENVYFGDSRRDSDSAGGSDRGSYSAPRPAAPQQQPAYDAPASSGDQFSELDDDDGELPF